MGCCFVTHEAPKNFSGLVDMSYYHYWLRVLFLRFLSKACNSYDHDLPSALMTTQAQKAYAMGCCFVSHEAPKIFFWS